jgi:hypothetical protein
MKEYLRQKMESEDQKERELEIMKLVNEKIALDEISY